MDYKVAIVTGGNRGLGLACVKQLAELGFVTIIGARDFDHADARAGELRADRLAVHASPIDIESTASVCDFFSRIGGDFGRIDVLVNNAGIFLEGGATFREIDEATLAKSINVNAMGAWRTCKEAAPLMIEQRFGRIVNVSTGWASLTEMQANAAAYRISKTALNALTRVIAEDFRDKGDIKVNSVCPGWVRTRMGGQDADVSPEEAAQDVIWAATLDADGPTGGFFKNRAPLPW